MTIITQKSLLDSLRRRLKSCDHFDLATAWATHGDPLAEVENAAERGVKVRALVGLYGGNVTTKEALSVLKEKCQLRVVPPKVMFHPKVYIFTYRNGRKAAWVGSANFTGKGFGHNKEVILEVSSRRLVSNVQEWFEEQWASYEWAENVYSEYLANYIPRKDEFDQRHDSRRNRQNPPRPPIENMSSLTKIVFRPARSKTGSNLHGEIDYFVKGARTPSQARYTSAAKGLHNVLSVLASTADLGGRFLNDCSHNVPSFQREERANGTVWKRLENIENVVWDRSRQIPAQNIFGEWWLSQDTTTDTKWGMVRGAVEAANRLIGEPGIKLEVASGRKTIPWPKYWPRVPLDSREKI